MIDIMIIDRNKNSVVTKLSQEQCKFLEIEIAKIKRNKTLKELYKEISNFEKKENEK